MTARGVGGGGGEGGGEGGRDLFSLYNYIMFFKILNHWADFNIILQKCCLGDPLPRKGKAYNEAKMRTQQKQLVEIFRDPRVVKQDPLNTGAKENQQLNHGEPRNRHKTFRPRPSNE